jgi:WXG100 family type VII secretion target
MADKDYTRANFVTLQQVEDDFRTTQKALQEELDTLQGELEKLLDPADPVKGFTGPAGEAYNTNKRKWQAAAQDMANTLNQITNTVRDVHTNYAHAEKASYDLWAH